METMPKIADSHAEVHLGTEEAPEAVAPGGDRPFRILLVGDFSGRGAPGAGQRRMAAPVAPRLIDRDNFDEVMAELDVRLELEGIALAFRELDDFHPDRLYERVPLFREIARMETAAPPPPPPPRRQAAGSGRLLDQIIAEGEPEPERPVSVEDANDLAGFIRRAMAGHTAPRETPDQRHAAEAQQEVAGELMRRLLRDPRTQALEAAWRATDFLVRGLDTDGDLKIYILDMALPELVQRIGEVQKALAPKSGWGLIAGDYSFGQSETEARVLARLAELAQSLGAPFVAEGRLPDDPGAAPAIWEKLRASQGARWIGLAMPRFLLRLPYGEDTAPIESFPFEEMSGSEHRGYLWGNPAFFCAQLIGQSFLAHGWELGGRLARRIDGLPQHIYREDGEAAAKPCAEVLMTERAAEDLLELGYMPLASLKNEPAALIVRFQSIANPPAPLAGLK